MVKTPDNTTNTSSIQSILWIHMLRGWPTTGRRMNSGFFQKKIIPCKGIQELWCITCENAQL